MLNREFTEKMIQAKQLEMEAIGSLMPEPVRTHIDVINRELKDMAKEMIVCCCTGSEPKGEREEKHKTGKIDIE